jgi:methyl-accepting chemotaxis protein
LEIAPQENAMLNNMTIKSRLMVVVSLLSLLLIGVGGLGLHGISQSNQNLKTVYEDRTVVAIDLSSILDRTQRVRLNAIMAANLRNESVARERAELSAQRDMEINAAWQKFIVTYLTPEEEQLANTWS